MRVRTRKNMTRLFSVCIALLTLIPTLSFAKEKVTVFAAASLNNALTEIGKNFTREHNINAVFSFASSSTLARQIAQGAPAQVYLSANQNWMDYLVEQQAVAASSRITLLRNSLVLIAPQTSPVNNIELNSHWNISASIGDSRLAVGDPDHVPAGRYAKQALENLGLWQQAEPLLARGSDVRGALVLVERGESPLGIVYGTDALVTKKIKTVATFPADSHKAIEYPLVLVDEKPSPAVTAFYQYLQGAGARAVFVKYGFEVN